MTTPDQERIVNRIKAEQAQQHAERAQETELLRRKVLAAEQQRAERLSRDIASWHQAMVEADYPQAEILAREIQNVKKGFFGTVIQKQIIDVPGWNLASLHQTGEYGEHSTMYRLDLAFDGKLTGTSQRSRRGSGTETTISDYIIGSHAIVKSEYGGGLGVEGAHPWGELEKQIPKKLIDIAAKAGLNWQPEASE